jgi:hypothetical protein
MSARRVIETAANLIHEMSSNQDQALMVQFIHDLLIAVQHTTPEDTDKLVKKLEELAKELDG